VQYIFTVAEFCVERDCSLIAIVRLNVYDPRPPLAGDLAQVSNERRSHPLAAIRFVDREIVNVDFAPVLLKLVQLVRNKSAYNSAMRERDQRNDVFLFEQPTPQ
jgi:hypothetical protein